MRYTLDNGRFPHTTDYNNAIRKGKRAVRTDKGISSDVMTANRALGVWKVVQDVNSVQEPTLALSGKKKKVFI